jgi:hypothetical protein
MGATDPSRPERRKLAHRVNSGLEVTLWLTRSPMPWGSGPRLEERHTLRSSCYR